MSNPVVLIATHQRVEITLRNVISLYQQSVWPKIVVVCSDANEFQRYRATLAFKHNILIVLTQNNPLGSKWQTGVNWSKDGNPDPLIILGSDDLLGKDFIKNVCTEMETADFVGFTSWFIHDEVKDKMYKMEYVNKNFPLGTRAYSKRMLEKMSYTCFDVKRDRLLDDYGWQQVLKSKLPYRIINDTEERGLNIVSVKGNWTTMNSADAIVAAKSCTVLQEYGNPQEKLNQLL